MSIVAAGRTSPKYRRRTGQQGSKSAPGRCVVRSGRCGPGPVAAGHLAPPASTTAAASSPPSVRPPHQPRPAMSGTTGFDYATMTISEDVVEQAEQCLRNIEAALAEAKCTFADVVRVRYLLPDRTYRTTGPGSTPGHTSSAPPTAHPADTNAPYPTRPPPGPNALSPGIARSNTACSAWRSRW